MRVIIITGSAGLIGGECVEFFADHFDLVVGIDNDMRQTFFGKEASTDWNRKRIEEHIPNYKHNHIDIRDQSAVEKIFQEYSSDIELIVHSAAQPSHDWAARDPMLDFTINANGTLVMLEATRRYAAEATFIFTSTNKVYGDTPNQLPLVEHDTRWEIDQSHAFFERGIDESMSIDNTRHSLFGASKVAADVLTQEYGKYFGIKTGIFRGGCLTGPRHSGTQLHGFLSYLMKCAINNSPYTVFGYKGKQVRDNIHARDLVSMFWHFHQNPQPGEVYNAGGSRHSNCSVLEAIQQIEEITGRKIDWTYVEDNRIGDHIWWISDVSKFKRHYPEWDFQYSLQDILIEIHDFCDNPA